MTIGKKIIGIYALKETKRAYARILRREYRRHCVAGTRQAEAAAQGLHEFRLNSSIGGRAP